jgi:D-arabinose 1-dehydrogenase-like Zn-dependent alcohol dehydrogenase
MTIPQTMKAAVVTELGKPLDIREHPVPQIGAGQVLVAGPYACLHDTCDGRCRIRR